jgi:hypothetical protein
MRSGTKLVFGFVVLAAAAFLLLRVYGERVMAGRGPETPISSVREYVLADNTVVGRMGGVREVAMVELRPLDTAGDTVALSAEVVGRAGGGMVFADLARVGGQWHVLRASFIAPDGERLPLEGPGRPTLERGAQ